MNSRRFVTPVCVSLLIGLAAGMPASAANWAVWEGQDAAAPHAIYTDGVDEAGAILACDGEGMLSAMLSLEPASLPDLMARSAKYARSTEGTVTVGDTEPATTKFRYTPANKTIETRTHSVAAKVFNAAILGEAVKVQTKREGSVEATLPAPNDAFKAFARTCNSLRKSSDT